MFLAALSIGILWIFIVRVINKDWVTVAHVDTASGYCRRVLSSLCALRLNISKWIGSVC